MLQLISVIHHSVNAVRLYKAKILSIGQVYWLIEWFLSSFSTLFHLYCGSQCIYPCFPGVLLTSTLHNIPFKPLAVFPHNHCLNYGSSKKEKKTISDYHQSSDRKMAEPEVRTSNLLWSTLLRYWLRYGSSAHSVRSFIIAVVKVENCLAC